MVVCAARGVLKFHVSDATYLIALKLQQELAGAGRSNMDRCVKGPLTSAEML